MGLKRQLQHWFEWFKLSSRKSAKGGWRSGAGTSSNPRGEGWGDRLWGSSHVERKIPNCEREMWEFRTAAPNPDIPRDGETESSEMEPKLKQELGQNFMPENRWD